MRAEFQYRDSSGNAKTGYMDLADYRLASQHNMTAAGVVNARHADADPKFGSAFVQGCHYLGIHVKANPAAGILPTTIGEVLSGDCIQKYAGTQMAGGMIVSPKTPIGGSTPSSRLFFPEVVTQLVQQNLNADYTAEMSAWNQMFAITTSITSEVWTQPLINTSAPQAQDMRPIGQNQLPTTMISITASETSQALGALSIGLQVSDQALRDTTIDLVGIIVGEQSLGMRQRNLWRDINRVVIGNPDARTAGLSSPNAALPTTVFKTTYDTTVGDNLISNAGWLKALWNPDRIYSRNFMLGDMDAYLAIQNRTGRPVASDPTTSGINTGNAGTYGLDAGLPQLINFSVAPPRMMLTPTGVIPAKQLLMFDSRYGLARVQNVAAAYAAVETQVLQRATFWRWDMSEFTYRFRDDAFLLLDYAKP